MSEEPYTPTTDKKPPIWRDAWRSFQDPYLYPDCEKFPSRFESFVEGFYAGRASVAPADTEWEYGAESRFKADLNDLDGRTTHHSLKDAVEYAATMNADEPSPNLFDGDDIECVWSVVRRRKAGPWVPVPTEGEEKK